MKRKLLLSIASLCALFGYSQNGYKIGLTLKPYANSKIYLGYHYGKLKALAVADDVRSASLPAVPTTIESGFPTLQATFWAGVVAPIGTPAHVIDKLNTSINEFLRSPEVEASLAKFNAKPKIGSPDDFAKFWRAETEKWTNLINAAGIRAD